MELSAKSVILFVAVILTGLSAGLFYAWSVSVIPGTRRLLDLTYLQSMQSINRAILNPAFFLVFFGSIIFLVIASVSEFNTSKQAFGLLMVCVCTYLFGTVGVTGLGNVPLNNQLEALDLAQASTEKLADFRKYYEHTWNRWHLIRSVFAVISFISAVLAILLHHSQVCK